MGDRKNLKIHYAGSFSKRRNGEELSHLDYRSKYPVKEMLDVDSDELNMIDFAADGIVMYLWRMIWMKVFVPPSQEYDETMCTLMDLKKLIKKRALNANDKGNSMQKKKKSFNDKGFGSKQNKKSGKDKGEAKGKKKSTTHMKGKGVLVDEEDSFWVELSKFSDEEMDTELPENPPRQPQIDQLDPDEGYHSINSSDEEIEWQQQRSDEFYNFVYETSNVYVDEGEIVMLTCSDEWKVGMEWPDIETLRHEISDYCIKNRFEVDMRAVNERYRIRAKCKGSYKGKDCPWAAYWRLRLDAFTMRLNTFVNEHICSADPELKNGMADANWVARKITAQMKVHYKTMSPRFIMAEVMRGDFHVSISYWTAWHARLKCLQDIHGDYGASYNMLPVLCDQILKSNPGSRACYSRTDVAVLYPRRVYWKEYCSSYYWVSTYNLACMGHIMPMPDMSEWPMNCDLERQIMPPPYVRGIGRPKKARTRGADEEVNPNKQIRLCSKCKQLGHNAKTCKGLPAAKKDKHGKKSQEETQASAPVLDEALESTEASQASSPTQASSSKAAKRVCSKCNDPGHNTKTCKGLPTAKKDKHGKKSQEKTQASQASAPVPDEAKKSIQASQVSAPIPEEALESTQSKSPKATQRVCKKKYVESTSEGPAPTKTSKAKSATKSTTEAAPKSSLQASQASSETPQSTAQPVTLTFGPPRVRRSKTAQAQVFKGTNSNQKAKATWTRINSIYASRASISALGATKATKKILPPLAPGPLPTSRKKFQVVRPK
ncbi:hypothetical protein IFM89_032292 [Coptis chinensis]|uniref:CCHC-type domain-containing protein n=1 Tax=Coptis chinensis TaxID=261450 RepID=A0A835H0U8_9MAGN|nr:hypothetical protein IFM89_032292 [Coptis chinensis]